MLAVLYGSVAMMILGAWIFYRNFTKPEVDYAHTDRNMIFSLIGLVLICIGTAFMLFTAYFYR